MSKNKKVNTGKTKQTSVNCFSIAEDCYKDDPKKYDSKLIKMIKKKMITQKNNGVGGFGMDLKNNNPNKKNCQFHQQSFFCFSNYDLKTNQKSKRTTKIKRFDIESE